MYPLAVLGIGTTYLPNDPSPLILSLIIVLGYQPCGNGIPGGNTEYVEVDNVQIPSLLSRTLCTHTLCFTTT